MRNVEGLCKDYLRNLQDFGKGSTVFSRGSSWDCTKIQQGFCKDSVGAM